MFWMAKHSNGGYLEEDSTIVCSMRMTLWVVGSKLAICHGMVDDWWAWAISGRCDSGPHWWLWEKFAGQ